VGGGGGGGGGGGCCGRSMKPGHSPPQRIEGYSVWNLLYWVLKGDGDKESVGNRN
jgi:hypothetical protein